MQMKLDDTHCTDVSVPRVRFSLDVNQVFVAHEQPLCKFPVKNVSEVFCWRAQRQKHDLHQPLSRIEPMPFSTESAGTDKVNIFVINNHRY